jgi:mRNA interferase RelE/StbE
MAWTIKFDRKSQRDFDSLGKQEAQRILRFLRDRVAVREDPRSLGAPLSGAVLGEYWRYRVGDYRVIVDIQDELVVIAVIRIGHRGDIYES